MASYTLDTFRDKILGMTDGKILVTRFTKVVERVDARCLVCGHEWQPLGNNVGYKGCPPCANKARGANRKARRPITEDEIIQALAWKEEGLSWMEIGRRLGRNQATIQRVCDPRTMECHTTHRTQYLQTAQGKAAINRSTAARRARLLEAIPEGTTAKDTDKTNSVYRRCARLNLKGNEVYHVDHIRPISKGGEHIWWNLQILPAAENLAKGDAFREVDQILYARRKAANA